MLARASAARPPGPPSAAASCCCPARSCCSAGRQLHDARGSTSPRRRRRPRPGGAGAARLAAHAAGAPGGAAGDAQRLGGGLLRPRPRPARSASPTGPPGSGVERFVLDDGWFHGRRDDTAGLGDWWVDEDVWPDGLDPLDRPRARPRHGVRAVVRARDGQPRLRPLPRAPRLDPRRRGPGAAAAPQPAGARPDQPRGVALPARPGRRRPRPSTRSTTSSGTTTATCSRPAARAHGGAPAAHAQNAGVLRAARRPPRRATRTSRGSPAPAGGGRIDLGVIERVQRFWTSDMTDALARQHIQRWTGQLVAPEYLGAHVSAPTSHQTGRTLSLDFRAATAFFGAFGIEWDLTEATDGRARGARRLGASCTSSSGRCCTPGRAVRIPSRPTRPCSPHGVVAADRGQRPAVPRAARRVPAQPGLHAAGARAASRRVSTKPGGSVRWTTGHCPLSPPLDPRGPTAGTPVTGRQLADVGPLDATPAAETAQLIQLVRRDRQDQDLPG